MNQNPNYRQQNQPPNYFGGNQMPGYNPQQGQQTQANTPPQAWRQGPPSNIPPRGIPPKNKNTGKKPQTPENKKKWTILGVFVIVGLILGGIIYYNVNKYAKSMTMISLPGAPVVSSSGKVVTETGEEVPVEEFKSLDLSEMVTEKGQAWDGSSRITCLAMGMDYRDWEAGEEFSRTDSMMLLTYDPVTGMAGMLSIPRDLWVAIPDHGYGRINTAYFLGESERLPGGGPGLAMQTVELLLGIDVQYYAVISFQGFIDFIDSIDKLAIHVKEQITVDPIGPGNTVTLYEGVQDLDGATALAYARFRYSEGGDFERAQRQQDVLYALYEQLVWQLPSMLGKADQLYADLSTALITNLTFNDMMKLAWTVVDLKPWQIVRSVIAPPNQVEYGTTADGTQQILIPIPDRIREARDVLFSTSLAAAPVTVSEDRAQIISQEGSRITIINGSTVPGLLERTTSYLQSFGITVVTTGTGSTAYNNSLEILDGKPFTAKFLQELMAIPTTSVTFNYDPGNDIDMILTITDAWANNNQMP